MPKRGQTTLHNHAPLTAEEETNYSRTSEYAWWTAYCGSGTVAIHKVRETEEKALHKATCPACAKKWGASELVKHGDRIEVVALTKEELPSSYLSGVKVTVDGVLRGFVASKKGFGKGWEILTLSSRPDPGYRKDFGSTVGARAAHGFDYEAYNAGKSYDGSPIWNLHRAARDASIAMFPTLVAEGFLPTVQEQLDKVEAAKAARIRDEEERAARLAEIDRRHAKQRADREEKRSLAVAALEAIADRAAALGLSNSETMGIQEALKLLG